MAGAKKDAAQEGGKQAEGESPKKSRTPLLVGGGAAAFVALGYILSLMAVPKKEEPKPDLGGPFVARLSKSDIQVNLAGEGNKRYLVMQLQAEYFAYDESYVAGRLGIATGGGGGHGGEAPAEDPIYTAQLKDALLKLASTKTRDQVTDPVLIDGFLEDIRTIVDPILFPIYVGHSHAPHEPDLASGIKVGESSSDSDFRGLLHEHELEVDSVRKEIRFDGGPAVEYTGKERDLELTDKEGHRVYVNLTQMKPDFSGHVPIGVPGHVRTIYRDSLLVQ